MGRGVGVGVLFWSAMLVSGCSKHAHTHTELSTWLGREIDGRGLGWCKMTRATLGGHQGG